MDEYSHTNQDGKDPNQVNYTPVAPEHTNNYQQPRPPINGPYNGYQAVTPNNEGIGFGIASLVLGIVSLISCCIIPFIGVIPSIAAIIFGVLGLKYPSSKGMSIAGIVLGGIGIALCGGLFLIVMLGIVVGL